MLRHALRAICQPQGTQVAGARRLNMRDHNTFVGDTQWTFW